MLSPSMILTPGRTLCGGSTSRGGPPSRVAAQLLGDTPPRKHFLGRQSGRAVIDQIKTPEFGIQDDEES